MGVNANHVIGHRRKAFAKTESTFGTQPTFAGTDAIKVLDMKLGKKRNRVDRTDNRASRSMIERITRKTDCNFSVETYALPAGAGTPPDIHPLLLSTFAGTGGYTNTPATSDVYSLAYGQAVLGSFSLEQEFDNIYQEISSGCVVDQMKFSVSGGNEAKFMFEGPCKQKVISSATTLDGAVLDTATSITVVNGYALENGSVVYVGTSNNSGAGHVLSDKSGSTFTVTPAISGGQSNGAVVAPVSPTETTAGSPISLINGSLVIDPDTTTSPITLPVTAFEITIKNNVKAIHDEAFQETMTDYLLGFREVTGKITCRGRSDHLILLGHQRDFDQCDLQVICGSTAGYRVKWDLNNIELEFEDNNIPSEEEMVISLPFKALATSGGEDEVTLTWY